MYVQVYVPKMEQQFIEKVEDFVLCSTTNGPLCDGPKINSFFGVSRIFRPLHEKLYVYLF